MYGLNYVYFLIRGKLIYILGGLYLIPMLRELIRTIVSAFKMFTRLFGGWFLFSVQFFFFFTFLGYLMGFVLILPLSSLFDQWAFNFRHPESTTNIWWLQQVITTGENAVVFSVGLLAAYLRNREKAGTFGGFLRWVPAGAWQLFLLLFTIFTLLNYCGIICGQSTENAESMWAYYFLTFAPIFIIYMGAALVYLRAANIKWHRKFLRKLVIYQAADMIVTFGLFVVLTVLLMTLRIVHLQLVQESWSFFFFTNGGSFLLLVPTILYYGCLLHQVFYESDDIELELENGLSDLVVIKR